MGTYTYTFAPPAPMSTAGLSNSRAVAERRSHLPAPREPPRGGAAKPAAHKCCAKLLSARRRRNQAQAAHHGTVVFSETASAHASLWGPERRAVSAAVRVAVRGARAARGARAQAQVL